jgi:hypothetical protein
MVKLLVIVALAYVAYRVISPHLRGGAQSSPAASRQLG